MMRAMIPIPSAALSLLLLSGNVAADEGGNPGELPPASDWHFRVGLTPPFARVFLRNGDEPWPYSWGRILAGIRSPDGIWGECAVGALAGLEGVGWDVSLIGGATLGRVRPAPGAWTITTPLFVGYRYARRPSSLASDGVRYIEAMNMVVFGAREFFTRWAKGGNGLELGLELAVAVPLTRDEPSSTSYYQDPPTRTSLEASLIVGWLLDL